MDKKTYNRGYSLIEILVVIGLLMVITIPLARLQTDIFSWNSFVQNSITAESQARSALKKMVRDVREMAPSGAGAYPIVAADRNTMTFFSDIDNDGTQEQVRYFVIGDSLKKGVINPTGSPAVYATSTEVLSTEVVTLVSTSTDLFQYFDDTTTTPLSLPINIPLVRSVRFTFMIDADPRRSPVPLLFTSQVSIRNLKDNF